MEYSSCLIKQQQMKFFKKMGVCIRMSYICTTFFFSVNLEFFSFQYFINSWRIPYNVSLINFIPATPQVLPHLWPPF